MNDQDVTDRLTPVFRSIFRDQSIVVRSDLTAGDVERWDSLSHIDMIMMVEEEFKIRIPTREITRMKNVGDLVRLIQAQSK